MPLISCIVKKLFRYRNLCVNSILLIFTFVILLSLVDDDQQPVLSDNTNVTVLQYAQSSARYGPNQTCKFPILNPYDETILKYVKHPFQLFCQNVQPEFAHADGHYLYIDMSRAQKLNLTKFRYRNLIRTSEVQVVGSAWSTWANLSEPLLLDGHGVSVEGLYGPNGERRYLNTYPSILVSDNKIKSADKQIKLNVLVFGLDSISRSNFIRNLPKTYAVLTDEMKSHQFFGYSKVDDNTFPNLLAMLTGHKVGVHHSELTGHFQRDFVDAWPFIWKNFSQNGYVTALIEEQPGFMSYKAKGFEHSPTDVYLRPFGMVLNKSPLRQYSSPMCVGNKAEARHYLDAMLRFLKTYSDMPYFMFSFLWKLSHDKTADIEMIDPLISKFFKSAFRDGLFNNTIVVVMSDHGNRFDSIRRTLIGRYEERMPYLSVYTPNWFNEKYSNAVDNLSKNGWRLTCQFDMFETFVDILKGDFSGQERATLKNRGRSLFSPIAESRTCLDVGIPNHFCVCQEEEHVDVRLDYVRNAADLLVTTINNLTQPVKKLCARLKLDNIVSAYMYKANNRVLTGMRWHFEKLLMDKNVTGIVSYLRITVTTNPNRGIYEGLLKYFSDQKPHVFNTTAADISRINEYGNDADCISMINRNLEKFCYCKKSWL